MSSYRRKTRIRPVLYAVGRPTVRCETNGFTVLTTADRRGRVEPVSSSTRIQLRGPAQRRREMDNTVKMEEQKWFERLTEQEQGIVRKIGNGLTKMLERETETRSQIGEYLAAAKMVCEPRRCWLKFLKAFNFSQRTAYRYMEGYSRAAEVVTPAVLKLAAEQSIDLIGSGKKPLGAYSDAVKAVGPPPKDEGKIRTWLSEVVEKKKEMGRVERSQPDRDRLQLSCARTVQNAFARLPNNSRVKGAWMREHLGICLGIAGMGTQSISPIAFPEVKERERVDGKVIHAHSAQASASAA